MELSSVHETELRRFHEFVTKCLTPHQARILELFSTKGMSNKELAYRLRRDVKTIDKIVSTIVRKHREFFGPSERSDSFRGVLCLAACYYFFKEALQQR